MKKNVLIVDDKAEFRLLVKVLLSKEYNVQTASNGATAQQVINSKFTPDIVVTDLNMPEYDGYELVDSLKTNNNTKNVPVIVLSSNNKSTDRILLLQKGANDYLIKPFNPEELKLRIENLLRITA